MIDQDHLMAIFQYLSAEKSVVRLYNTYRGLPLDTDTAIVGVAEGEITTSVFGYQAVSMALEGQTHLQAPSLPGTLRATVVQVDLKKKRAVLTDFTNVEGSVGNRRLVRVEPSENLEVKIYDGRQHIRGKVADISSEGMCIYTFFANLYGLNFENDKEVFIDFIPPYSNSTVRYKGIITSLINRQEGYLHRLGLKIYTSPEIKSQLEEYINRRQKEIMNELEKRYLTLKKRKKSRRE